MKIAIIGSRSVSITHFECFLPKDCDEIVSGGATGIDSCAARFAKEKGLKLTVFLPQYKKFGRAAPIVRNKEIVSYADQVLAFWDGTSKGTLFVIRLCERLNKPCRVIRCEPTP